MPLVTQLTPKSLNTQQPNRCYDLHIYTTSNYQHRLYEPSNDTNQSINQSRLLPVLRLQCVRYRWGLSPPMVFAMWKGWSHHPHLRLGPSCHHPATTFYTIIFYSVVDNLSRNEGAHIWALRHTRLHVQFFPDQYYSNKKIDVNWTFVPGEVST